MTRLRRLSALFAFAGLAAVLSGCVSIKSQSAIQRLPGFVTLRVEVCVSDRNSSTYTTCVPGTNTAENDNAQDGDVAGGGRGQLLAGFRVPAGTVAPGTFVTTDGSLSFARSASYTNALNANFPASAGRATSRPTRRSTRRTSVTARRCWRPSSLCRRASTARRSRASSRGVP